MENIYWDYNCRYHINETEVRHIIIVHLFYVLSKITTEVRYTLRANEGLLSIYVGEKQNDLTKHRKYIIDLDC